MLSLRETTDDSLLEARKAGAAYWRRNRPSNAACRGLPGLARSCGWHGPELAQWLAGYYEARRDA
jgi:hypothetical protein